MSIVTKRIPWLLSTALDAIRSNTLKKLNEDDAGEIGFLLEEGKSVWISNKPKRAGKLTQIIQFYTSKADYDGTSIIGEISDSQHFCDAIFLQSAIQDAGSDALFAGKNLLDFKGYVVNLTEYSIVLEHIVSSAGHEVRTKLLVSQFQYFNLESYTIAGNPQEMNLSADLKIWFKHNMLATQSDESMSDLFCLAGQFSVQQTYASNTLQLTQETSVWRDFVITDKTQIEADKVLRQALDMNYHAVVAMEQGPQQEQKNEFVRMNDSEGEVDVSDKGMNVVEGFSECDDDKELNVQALEWDDVSSKSCAVIQTQPVRLNISPIGQPETQAFDVSESDLLTGVPTTTSLTIDIPKRLAEFELKDDTKRTKVSQIESSQFVSPRIPSALKGKEFFVPPIYGVNEDQIVPSSNLTSQKAKQRVHFEVPQILEDSQIFNATEGLTQTIVELPRAKKVTFAMEENEPSFKVPAPTSKISVPQKSVIVCDHNRW